jgi:hypothetical protein
VGFAQVFHPKESSLGILVRMEKGASPKIRAYDPKGKAPMDPRPSHKEELGLVESSS